MRDAASSTSSSNSRRWRTPWTIPRTASANATACSTFTSDAMTREARFMARKKDEAAKTKDGNDKKPRKASPASATKALLKAIDAGDLEGVRNALAAGANVHARFSNG